MILIDRRSVNSCNLGVPVGGGEPRVFLLFHLGHTSQVLFLKSVLKSKWLGVILFQENFDLALVHIKCHLQILIL